MNELTISLDTRSRIPLYEQIYDYIKTDIQSGRIPYGEKLPSTRFLSKHLEVSRSTVELAYEQLLSEGYIESVPYKGFFVAQIDEMCIRDSHGSGVIIGETAEIGDNVTLYQGVTLGGTGKEQGKRHPTLKDNVIVSA